MPYVKRTPRYKDGNVIRYDYYWATDVVIEGVRTTKIIGRATKVDYETRQTVPLPEQLSKNTEHTERDIEIGAKALLKMFHVIVERKPAATLVSNWAKKNPDEVEQIRKLEKML